MESIVPKTINTSPAGVEQPKPHSRNQKSVPGARGDSPSSRQQASWKVSAARKVIADRILNRPAPSKEAVFDDVLTLAMALNSAEGGNYAIQVIPDYDYPTRRPYGRFPGLTEKSLLRDCERAGLASAVEAMALRKMVSKAIAWCAKHPAPIGWPGLSTRLKVTQVDRGRLKVYNIKAIDHDEAEAREHRLKCQRAYNKKWRRGNGDGTVTAYNKKRANKKTRREYDATFAQPQNRHREAEEASFG